MNTKSVDPVAHLRDLSTVAARSADALADGIRAATELTRATLKSGGTLFFVGNGGSAADAQHIATEYTIRYMRTRRALRAIEVARAMGIKSVALTAKDGGRVKADADLCLVVPTDRTDIAQEIHLAIQHAICDVVDAEAAGG